MNAKLIALLLLAASPVFAQTTNPLRQSGKITPGHAVQWTGNGIVQDAGTATRGTLTGLGITASGPSLCVNSDVVTATGWQQICFGITTAGGATISTTNFGTAPTAGFTFLINGASQSFPTIALPTTTNQPVCFLNTAGALTGCSIGPGNVVGPASAVTGHLATFADTTGKVIQDGGAVGSTTLTGDVTGTGTGTFATTIAANAVTNGKFRQGSGLSVVGVTGNATANEADIVGTTDQVLRVNTAGNGLTFGQLNLAASAAVTGQLIAGSFPALTGDVTTPGGSLGTTLATVNANTGSWGSATQAPQITVNGKGLVTAASNVTVTPAFSSVTGQATLAQLPTIAGNSVLSNLTGGATVPAANSPSAILDAIGSTQGTILYRDASAWLTLAPGSSGQLLSSNGTAANPSWVTASGTGTVTSVGNDGSIKSSIASNGAITSTGNLGLFGEAGSLTNCILNGTVSGNALTVAIKTQAGADPSATAACVISFRNATIATGDFTYVKVTAATSFVTAASGDTFGSVNSTPFRLWITAWNNAGTVVLGVSNQSGPTQIFPLNEGNAQSSTACSACGTATSRGVFYTTAAQTSKAIRILGYMDWASGLGTAGVWASGPTTIQLMGPGIKKPGDVVQTVYSTTTTPTASSSPTKAATNLTGTITPTSATNLVKVQSLGALNSVENSTNSYAFTQLWRGTGSTAIGNISPGWANGGAAMGAGAGANFALDNPQTISSTQYGVYLTVSAGAVSWSFLGTQNGVGTNTGVMILEEIQGSNDHYPDIPSLPEAA